MMTKLADMPGNGERRTTWRRYLQFCLVGGSGVAVDMAVIWGLADPANLGWNLTLSKVLAAEVAIVNNFLWNDVWTFRGLGAGGWRGRFGRFAKFNLICTTGIGLSVLLLQGQVAGLGMNVYLANFISIVAVSGWNFGMNLKFGWNAGAGARRVGGPGRRGAQNTESEFREAGRLPPAGAGAEAGVGKPRSSGARSEVSGWKAARDGCTTSRVGEPGRRGAQGTESEFRTPPGAGSKAEGAGPRREARRG